MPLNVQILEQVKECILKEPTQFDMDVFYEHSQKSSCGTMSCIAGWVVWLGNKKIRENLSSGEIFHWDIDWIGESNKILGMWSHDLYYNHYWCYQDCSDYYEAKSPEEKAKIACRVIDKFIKKNKSK